MVTKYVGIVFILSMVPFCTGNSTKIVNGTTSSPGQFPYAVSVRYFQEHECGGSIIGPDWVLTAAHCIYSDFINVSTILYGSIKLRNGESPESYTAEVADAYIHEKYIPSGGYENDIGLLRLKQSLEFNAFVQPVSLPAWESEIPVGDGAILVGWGYPESDIEIVMEVLQFVVLTIFPDDTCFQYHGVNYSTTSHICVGVVGGGKGQCSGDSGGPLTVNGTQHGIVSWSDKPCAITPGVLTRVATYRRWIFEKTGI